MSKIITVILYKSEVVYDVQNKTHLTARSRQNGDNVEFTANIQVNDNDPEMNQVMRSIGNGFDKLAARLAPYRKEMAPEEHRPHHDYGMPETMEADNAMMETRDNEMKIELVMTNNFNQSFLGAAITAMHEYLVNTVLAEWYTLTSPSDAAFYYSQAESNFQDVKSCLEKRIKPVRRKLTLF